MKSLSRPTILISRTYVHEVFQNLIGNAIKFIDKEKGIIHIKHKDIGDYWQFSVADNGPGINEKYFDKIFQIFQSLQPMDSPDSTGIGLSIVKKIVELWGGNIWVESKVNEGSVFYFTIPKGV